MQGRVNQETDKQVIAFTHSITHVREQRLVVPEHPLCPGTIPVSRFHHVVACNSYRECRKHDRRIVRLLENQVIAWKREIPHGLAVQCSIINISRRRDRQQKESTRAASHRIERTPTDSFNPNWDGGGGAGARRCWRLKAVVKVKGIAV